MVAPKKSLGQHFLHDANIVSRIVRAAGDLKNTPLLEIGPGLGVLTRAMLEAGATSLYVIEKDTRCLDALETLRRHYPEALHIISGDALKISLDEQLPAGKIKIVANLPYNVGTELLINWLHDAARFESMILMFQKEVGERIVAKPDSDAYGRLSILAQWLCQTEFLFTVPRGAFNPPPKVESAVVKLTPRAVPAYPADLATLEKTTQALFHQRRKMIRASLRAFTPDYEAVLSETGLDPTARPENLTLENFCSLARALASRL